MERMIRSLRSTLGKAVILCAFALTLIGDTSAASNAQESGDSQQQRRRHQNELTFTQIDFLGALATLAFDLNDRGQIVGNLVDAGGRFHGFLLANGEFRQIDLPAGETNTFGINDRGQIVGLFFDGQSLAHGYLLDNGAFTQIDFPGALETQAQKINNRGQIVGNFLDTELGIHRYLLDNGVSTVSSVPGPFEQAPGINDRGQIVSEFKDTAGVFHGFLLTMALLRRLISLAVPLGPPASGSIIAARLWANFHRCRQAPVSFMASLDDGVFTQIDFPGAVGTSAWGINDRGQIVGIFAYAGGVTHGFLATKEQFSGKAIGVGASGDNAAVEIAGTFTSPIDLDLSAATLTITNLLNEQAGSGELAQGLPLVLTAAPGSRRKLALFIDRSRPNIVSVTILDTGSGTFIFKIKVNDATIISPQNCSPTRLTTSFRLEVSGKPPIIVSTERSWFCFGPSNRFLKTH